MRERDTGIPGVGRRGFHNPAEAHTPMGAPWFAAPGKEGRGGDGERWAMAEGEEGERGYREGIFAERFPVSLAP